MSPHFVLAKPLQACKLVAIIATLFFAGGAVYGIVPNHGLTGFFLVVLLSVGLALTVFAETVVAGYRSLTADASLADQLSARSPYTVVRAIEAVSAIIWASSLGITIAMLPDEPPSGPGAIGLLFIITGIGLVVLGGSLVRTLVEYYLYRRDRAA